MCIVKIFDIITKKWITVQHSKHFEIDVFICFQELITQYELKILLVKLNFVMNFFCDVVLRKEVVEEIGTVFGGSVL